MNRTSLQRQIIGLGYWIASICEGASRIILPIYFTSAGYTASNIALMFLVFEVFGILTNIFSGYLMNRFGYKKAYVYSLLFHTIASFGYLFLDLWLGFLLVNLLRAFRGVGKELIKTSSSAYFKQLSVDRARHQHINVLLGGKDTMKGLGFWIGGLLLASVQFEISFLILGSSTLLLLLLACLYVNDYRERRLVGYRDVFNVSQDMKILSLIRIFLYLGRDVWVVVVMPIFLIDLGFQKDSTGLILALGLVVFGISQTLTGYFIKSNLRVGNRCLKSSWYYESVIPPVTYVLTLVPLAMYYVGRDSFLVVVLLLLYNVFAGICTSPHNYLHVLLAQKDRASVDIAFYKTVSQIGKVVAVPLSGILYDTLGMGVCFSASASFLFMSGTLGLLLRKNRAELRAREESLRRSLANVPALTPEATP